MGEPLHSLSSSLAARSPTSLARTYLLVICLAVLPAGFLFVDPWVLGLARELDRDLQQFFRGFTDLGKSNWMLIPTGLVAIALYGLYRRAGRRESAAAFGFAAQIAAYIFATVAGAGILASLAKNTIGRARPRHFDLLGAVEFQPFAFVADFAAFPSGHATNIFAFAGAIAVLWPRLAWPVLAAAAVIAATRVMVGAHYFTDVLGGAALGLAFAYGLRNRLAARRWLFEWRDGAVVLRGGRVRERMAAGLRPGASR